MIEIYTDGACNFNTRGARNLGGWSYVVVKDGSVFSEGHGKFRNTTNNRMELMAAIKALTYISKQTTDSMILYSDSQYLVKTMMEGWKRKKNNDLWDQLDKFPNVLYVHVKGHADNEFNERCDRLATVRSTNILIEEDTV